MTRMTAFGAAAALVGTLAIGLAAQAPASFKRTLLQQADLSAPGREVVQALAEFQPAGAIGRHSHPGEEISYVIEGAVLIEIDGQAGKTYQAGQSFLIPAGVVHDAKNAGSGITKVVATYVIEKGKPVSTPAK